MTASNTEPRKADRVEGDVDVVLHLDEVEAVRNPELMGKAEWRFELKINGRESWTNDKLIKVGKGERVPVGASVEVEVPAAKDVLEVQISGLEHDLLSPDDPASGEPLRLYRTAGFERADGFVYPLTGPGTELKLHFSVEVRPMAPTR